MNCTLTVRHETFDGLAARWQHLLSLRSHPTVFDTPTWQRVWWEHFSGGASLKLLSVCEGPGAPSLIAPMMSRDGAVSFLGGTDLVDYHDFLAPDGARPQDVEAVFRELSREPGCSCMELLSIADGSPALGFFATAAKAAGWQVEVAKEDVAPRMELPSTWDEYVEGLDKKERHEMRRKMRRIEGAGELRDIELTAPAGVGAAIGGFFALHRMSRPDKAEFMTPARERFFRAVSVALAEEGKTRLRFLELDGERVATSLSFVVGPTRYLYNSGFDPRRSDLSVGLMNHAYAIKSSIAEGLKVFDFMRGNEPYKYRLGGKDRAIYRIIARR